MSFLVSKETGTLLHNDKGGFYVWDKASGKAVATTKGVKTLPAKDVALEGEYEVDGTECQTAFTGYRKHLAQFTLEKAEAFTDVPVTDIEKLTYEYSSAESAYIVGALGLRYLNAGEAYRAFCLLGALTGNVGKVGSGATSEFLPATTSIGFNDIPLVHPDGLNKARYCRSRDFFQQCKIQNPFPIKGLIVSSGNPVHNYGNRGRWINDVIPNLDLFVDIDIWMTDTGEMADYVLPDCMPFEREDIIYGTNYGHLVLQEPAIEPPHEQKDPSYLYRELTKRLGIGEYFDKDAAGWLTSRIHLFSWRRKALKAKDTSFTRTGAGSTSVEDG